MDGQSAAAVFAAKGIDVTTTKDRGVIKVFIAIAVDLNVLYPGHGHTFFMRISVFSVEKMNRKPFVVLAGREASGAQRREADDWGQSHCPLHWKAAHRGEV